jgi:acetyl esterase/lipase
VNHGADSVAETVAFNERLAALQSTLPPLETVPPEETRAARMEEGGIFPPPVFLPQARWLEIPSRGGGLRVRVVAPTSREAMGAYLHFHGGGWTIGAADGQDPLLEAIAEMTGLCAVSVEYRLAPEDPYPAGPDDCEDAALWLLDGGAAELGVPQRFAVGGESAGGHLSAVTLLRLRDRHGITDAFAAANLVFGAFDLTGTPSRLRWDDSRPLVLTNSGMTWFTECFLPGVDDAGRRDPDISPLYADLRGMPPALFTIGTADPLLDDSLFMAARWQAAGNAAELRVYEEGCHAFTAFPLAVAQLANAAQLAFLRDAVG